MEKAFLLPIIPALIIGWINGAYWHKQGYNRYYYAILGALMAYALIFKAYGYYENHYA